MTRLPSRLRPDLRTANLTRGFIPGAAIGLALISFFLVGAGSADPSWPRLWMVRPLILVPLAGGLAGACFAALAPYRRGGSGWRILAWPVSILGFVVAIWLGTVLGLDGTYWD